MSTITITIDFSSCQPPIVGTWQPEAGRAVRQVRCEHEWWPAPDAESQPCGNAVWIDPRSPGWSMWPRRQEVVCPDCAS